MIISKLIKNQLFIKRNADVRHQLKKRYEVCSLLTRIFIRFRLAILPLEMIEPHVPRKGIIIDMGCGHGLLSHYLTLTGPDRKVIGTEYNARLVSIANKTTNQGYPKFITTDASKNPLPKGDSILFIDLLHHLTYQGQQHALNSAATALPLNGRLIIKDIEREKTWRFYWNLFHDRILRQSGPTYHSTSTELKQCLQKLGFKIITEDHYYPLAYHHNLLIAEKIR